MTPGDEQLSPRLQLVIIVITTIWTPLLVGGLILAEKAWPTSPFLVLVFLGFIPTLVAGLFAELSVAPLDESAEEARRRRLGFYSNDNLRRSLAGLGLQRPWTSAVPVARILAWLALIVAIAAS